MSLKIKKQRHFHKCDKENYSLVMTGKFKIVLKKLIFIEKSNSSSDLLLFISC
jgi:hypothetical protein